MAKATRLQCKSLYMQNGQKSATDITHTLLTWRVWQNAARVSSRARYQRCNLWSELPVISAAICGLNSAAALSHSGSAGVQEAKSMSEDTVLYMLLFVVITAACFTCLWCGGLGWPRPCRHQHQTLHCSYSFSPFLPVACSLDCVLGGRHLWLVQQPLALLVLPMLLEQTH